MIVQPKNDSVARGSQVDLNASGGAEAIRFDVYDLDRVGQDDWIGGVALSIDELMETEGRVMHGWFPLKKSAADRKARGEVRLGLGHIVALQFAPPRTHFIPLSRTYSGASVF